MGEDEALRRILAGYTRVAVYGMSTNPEKAAQYVPVYLQEHGYEIIPVNPRAEEILGRKCYPDLKAVPDRIEILDVFRPSEEALGVVREAVERRRERGDVEVIWLQLGIRNDEARKLAEGEGITFVQDHCMLAEHRRLGLDG